jgi:nitrogen regulatory protein P-II 1
MKVSGSAGEKQNVFRIIKGGDAMVKVECILRHDKIAAIQEALSKLGVRCMTVTEALGFISSKVLEYEPYQNDRLNLDLLPKADIEVVVSDDMAEDVITAVIIAAKSGGNEGGTIYISPISDDIRIRSGERGEKSIGLPDSITDADK